MAFRRFRLSALVAAAIANGAAAAAPMRVCTVVWPPYSVLAADGKSVAGSHSELVKRVMAAAGFEISIELVSWERCLKDLAGGYYAAAYAASYRDDRAAYAVYPREPIDVVSYVAVVRKGEAPGWDDKRALSALPWPIGSPGGWSVSEDLRKNKGVAVDDSSTANEQDIRKLLAGRIGTAVVAGGTAKNLLDRLDPQHRLEVLETPVVEARRYFVIFGRNALGDAGAVAAAERASAALVRERAAK